MKVRRGEVKLGWAMMTVKEAYSLVSDDENFSRKNPTPFSPFYSVRLTVFSPRKTRQAVDRWSHNIK